MQVPQGRKVQQMRFISTLVELETTGGFVDSRLSRYGLKATIGAMDAMAHQRRKVVL